MRYEGVPVRADLHAHTRCSDGELEPAALVARAAGAGVTHLAVTDHDTVAGLVAAAGAGLGARLTVIPGIEVTAALHGREIHVLGHHLLPAAPGLAQWCADRRLERRERLREMTARLVAQGLRLDFDAIERESGDANLGRPHLARAIVQGGYARSFQEAFDRYLTSGKSGYVERPRPQAGTAIDLIRHAGGTTSIAHPGINRVSRAELRQLADLGLDAAEAYHPDHPPQQAGDIARWARDCGLEVTGGSDFHGATNASVELGAQITPQASYEVLLARAMDRRQSPDLAVARNEWSRVTGP